jgi:hypothetical protein
MNTIYSKEPERKHRENNEVKGNNTHLFNNNSMYLCFFKKFLLFIYSHVCSLFMSFLSPCPPSLAPPLPPSLPGRICSALIANFVEEKT